MFTVVEQNLFNYSTTAGWLCCPSIEALVCYFALLFLFVVLGVIPGGGKLRSRAVDYTSGLLSAHEFSM